MENTVVGDLQGYPQYFGGVRVPIEPFSNVTVSGNVDDIDLHSLEPTGNWRLSLEFTFETPLGNDVSVGFVKEPATVHVTGG